MNLLMASLWPLKSGWVPKSTVFAVYSLTSFPLPRSSKRVCGVAEHQSWIICKFAGWLLAHDFKTLVICILKPGYVQANRLPVPSKWLLPSLLDFWNWWSPLTQLRVCHTHYKERLTNHGFSNWELGFMGRDMWNKRYAHWKCLRRPADVSQSIQAQILSFLRIYN